MSYRLIALDLDMTLLNEEKRISEKNKYAVKMAKEKGLHIVLCSGRILKGVMHYARVLNLSDEVVIACNGAIVRDLKKNSDIFYAGMKNKSSLEVADICKKNNIYYHYYCGDTMVAQKLDYSSKFYFEKNKELPPDERINIIIDDSFTRVKECGDLITKFVIVDNDIEKVDYVRKLIEENVEEIETTKSDINILEVMRKGVNKKKALEFVCSYLKIKKDEVIAIGDNENDIEMIRFASVGIAMGNAIDELKDIANFITDTFENDGVAKAIHKFVLEDKVNVQGCNY